MSIDTGDPVLLITIPELRQRFVAAELRAEAELLTAHLARAGSVPEAAKAAGIGVRQFRRLLERNGLSRRAKACRFPPAAPYPAPLWEQLAIGEAA